MTPGVLEVLRCPACESRVAPAGEAFRCAGCRRGYPVVNGVPRMVVDARGGGQIAQSFGFQWRARSRNLFEAGSLYGLSMEEERQSFFDGLGITPDQLAGKRVLDAGCGDGFLLRILGKYPAEVVGIDFNSSIEIPHQNCRHLSNVTVLQADILTPPFAAATFDYVWCEGVLVCTDDPRKGFQILSRLVKPDGRLYVWVYPSERLSIYQRIRDLVRVGHTLPRWLLLPLCYALALPLSMAQRLRRRSRTEPIRAIAFALFDNLSPRVQTRHTVAEVGAWFEENGFSDLRQTGLIGMSGTRR